MNDATHFLTPEQALKVWSFILPRQGAPKTVLAILLRSTRKTAPPTYQSTGDRQRMYHAVEFTAWCVSRQSPAVQILCQDPGFKRALRELWVSKP